MKKLHGAAKRIFGGLENRLSQLARFGQSKHQAKEEERKKYQDEHGNLTGYNSGQVDGIYSIGTMRTYREAMVPFAEWLADQGQKNASKITREQAVAYLQHRQQQGLSADTYSRDMAAINKALDFDITKKEAGLKNRSNAEITRSRLPTENDNRKFRHDQDQITLAKACGCRRASVTRITPADCKRNSAGLVVGIRVVEKGGKERVAPVLNACKSAVTAIIDRAQDQHKPIFDHYDSHIDNHAFRALYCSRLMRQLEEEKEAGVPWFGGDLNSHQYIHLKGKDKTVGPTYRGHPTDVVAAVSGAMGHNRLSIIFSNYSYARDD